VADRREQKRMRAGVVGAGHMGQYHILVYAELWDVDLVGVVDIDGERAAAVARHFDTRAFADHRDLIGKVDAVSVAVPTEQHFHVARDLLEAGIGVLIEKPITPTLEEARELFAIARRSGAALQVGHVERFNGAVQELRKIVERPILVESRRLGPFVARVQKDTVVMDLMIHDLDIVLALAGGEVEEVRAAGLPILSPKIDIANVRVAFDNGCVANFTASRVSTERVRKLRFFQPGQYISLDYSRQDVVVFSVDAGPEGQPQPGSQPRISRQALLGDSFGRHAGQPHEEPLRAEVRDFLECVRTRRAPLVGGAEGRRALDLALRIVAAIDEHNRRLSLGNSPVAAVNGHA